MQTIKWLIDVIKPVLDNIEQPITAVDSKGCFVYYNNICARIDGTDPKEVIGQHLLHVNSWLKEEESTLLQCLKTQKQITNNYQVLKGFGGIQTNYLHSVTPLFDSEKHLIGAIEIGRAVKEIPQLIHTQPQTEIPTVITQTKTLQEEIKKLDIFAQTDVPLILYGETGTGKELIAQRGHALSQRALRPLMSINCAAIPETLLESTLFGTVRGAFTGAENHKGLFALANGGTIFLDEINSMHISLQSKLLRVLQDGYFMPIGTQAAEYTDVRIIAALNQSPSEAIKMGHLRKDLYYRLNIGEIYIPPLRERKEDIALLAQFFVSKFAPTFQKDVTTLSDQALHTLTQYAWPGNVRELQNTISRSLLLHRGGTKLNQIVLTQTYPAFIEEESKLVQDIASQGLDQQLEEQEKNLIVRALFTHRYNITAAAKALKMPRTTLNSKIKKFKL